MFELVVVMFVVFGLIAGGFGGCCRLLGELLCFCFYFVGCVIFGVRFALFGLVGQLFMVIYG